MLLPIILHRKEYQEFASLLLGAMLNAFKNGESSKYPLTNYALSTKVQFFQDILKMKSLQEWRIDFLNKVSRKYKYINTFELPFFQETCQVDVVPLILDNKERYFDLHFYIQGYTRVGLLKNQTLQRYYYLMWKALENYKGEEDPYQLLEEAKNLQITWAVDY